MPRNQETEHTAIGSAPHSFQLLLLVVMLVMTLATACNRAQQEPTSTTEYVTPAPDPSSKPDGSAGETRVVSSQSPPATYTPAPTLTYPPSPAPAPVPASAPASEGQLNGQRNPLTGELVADPLLLERRPLAVKISNAPAKWTRPQSGLSQADLVFEHLTEGSITRFTAIFYGHTPAKLGPIRSARLIDLQLPAMYDSALVYSGSSIGVSRQLFASDFQNRILRTNTPGYYRTGEDKPYEHTLYAVPEKLWETLSERGENRQPELGPGLVFGGATPQGGSPAGLLTVQYGNFAVVEWRFDPSGGQYLRWVDGQQHTDANTGEQIRADNVVVLLVPHRLDETICEYQSGGRCLAYSLEIQMWGEGQAQLLRDGLAYDVTWSRQQRQDQLTLVDAQRRPIPLAPGNTWFQIVPADKPEAYSIGQ